MLCKWFDATIYAKVQPRPLIGDEHYPNGCVGITFKPTPSVNYDGIMSLIEHLSELSQKLKGNHGQR